MAHQEESSLSEIDYSELQIWNLLAQVRDGMIALRDRELAPVRVTAVQGGVLWVIDVLNNAGVPATPTEISHRLFRRPPTVWALVNRMEKLGLVKCTRNTQGKRQVLVEMTEQGQDVYRRFLTEREVIPKILESISSSERDQLIATLEKLGKTINEELTAVPQFM